MSQQKILSDLQVREEERVHRETEIMKELISRETLQKDDTQGLYAHLR